MTEQIQQIFFDITKQPERFGFKPLGGLEWFIVKREVEYELRDYPTHDYADPAYLASLEQLILNKIFEYQQAA